MTNHPHKEALMKNRTVQKSFSVCFAVCLMLMILPGSVFSWDLAAHTFMEEHLFKKQDQADVSVMYNRIYGAGAMDMFNNVFTSPYLDFANYLHDPNSENFLKAWTAAVTREEKAFAYGFAGHNNRWGMDSTAHISGITFGRGEGYVIAKAKILAAHIKPIFESQGFFLPDDVLLSVCHYLVEAGVDMLVREIDPTVGTKLIAAAYSRSNQVPELLVNAFKGDFSAIDPNAEQTIRTAEANFRVSTMAYGWALTQDNAFDLVAQGLATTGAVYLGLPPEAVPGLVPLVKQGMGGAMMICAPDFERELRATTGWVNGNLSSEGVVW